MSWKGPSARLLLLSSLLEPPFKGTMMVACAGLVASSMLGIHADLPSICAGSADQFSLSAVVANSRFLNATNPPGSLALAWFTMLIAMMPPLLALPLSHVRASSLADRRLRASTGFLLGYFGVWFLAGYPILAVAIVLRLLVGNASAALVAACLLALIWSASPMQMAAQNRAHRLRRIGLFGLAADRDCVAFGATLGGWCLASSWPWMLVPLFVAQAHTAAMLGIAAIVMAERLRGPSPLRWRFPVVLSIPAGWIRGTVICRRSSGATGHV